MSSHVSAPVVSVTVYPGQARVVRRVRAEAAVGASEILVADLPLSLVHESVRVTGRGAASILGVDVRTEHRASDESRRVAELLAEQQRLVVAAQELADRRRVLDVRVTVVESVAASSGRPYAKALAESRLSPGDLGPVAARLADQLAEVLEATRSLLHEERRLAEERARVDRELAESGGATPDRTAVVVAVESDEGGEVELEVSYLVDGATWEPRYDIRLDGAEVDVTWFGMVRQWSGEDWPACELRLSTARPTAAIAVPDLDPWYLAERPTYRAVPPPMAAPASAGSTYAAASGVIAPEPVAMLREAAPLKQVATVKEEGVTAATYLISRPVSVPADSSDHQALITGFRLPARVDHVTAPMRGDDVYLRATIVNTSGHTLRPGRASLFHGTEFVGASDLDVVAPGEEMELALGLDDRIRVTRELVSRKVDKAFLGTTARHEARWRTTVANHSGKPADITVLDQVPVSLSPGIVVKDVKLAPEATLGDAGEVSWRLALADGAQAELVLGVRVEVVKGVTMAGWRD